MTINARFTIRWISPLPLEREAAELVLGKRHPQEEVHHKGTIYLDGRIGHHEVVIGVQRKIGLSGTAVLAEKMSAGFPVSIAGSVPRYGTASAAFEIVLGDAVISSPRGNHGGLPQYNMSA